MRYRRRPTHNQWIMIACMGVMLSGLVGFGIYEITGIIDAATAEDTFSEWVWDLSPWVMGVVAAASIILGGILSWSGIHYIEGYVARRRRERRDRRVQHVRGEE